MSMVPSTDIEVGMTTYFLSNIPPLGQLCRCREKENDFIVIELLDKEILAKIKRKRKLHEFVILMVQKKWGMDTLTFRRDLSRKLGLREKDLVFLGIKDSRATAIQHFFIRKNITVGKGRFKVLGFIRPKDLRKKYRNFFEIKVSCKNINREALSLLSNTSITIPNYFGYQRFGGLRLVNHIIGELIIKRKFKEAVLLYLTYTSPFEPDIYTNWRKELKDRLDFKSALKAIPPGLYYEKLMLTYLLEKPNNYLGALRRLPLKLRRLLVQSFQSYLFNILVSERVLRGLPIEHPLPGEYGYSKLSEEITIADASTKRFKLRLLLPLFGYAYKMPYGEQGEIEKRILKERELTLKDFYIKEAEEFSLSGGFRQASMEIYFNSLITGKNNVHINAVLDKGCYVTILLREIFKPENPILQGFSS